MHSDSEVILIRTDEDGDWRDYHEFYIVVSFEGISHKGGMFEPPSFEVTNVWSEVEDERFVGFFTDEGIEEIKEHVMSTNVDCLTFEHDPWIKDLVNPDWVNPWANEPD